MKSTKQTNSANERDTCFPAIRTAKCLNVSMEVHPLFQGILLILLTNVYSCRRIEFPSSNVKNIYSKAFTMSGSNCTPALFTINRKVAFCFLIWNNFSHEIFSFLIGYCLLCVYYDTSVFLIGKHFFDFKRSLKKSKTGFRVRIEDFFGK